MFIVASIMKFRAMVDASDYSDLLTDETEGTLEPEIHPAKEGGHNVITVIRNVGTRGEAEELAAQLREFSYGSPRREPQVLIKDLSQVREPRAREPQIEDDVEQRSVREVSRVPEEVIEEAIPSGETPYRLAYRQTPQFRESQKRYQQSSAGKEAQRRYTKTVEGSERRSAYTKSEKGKARRKEHQERQKTERKSYSITNKETNEFVDIIESEARESTRFLGIEAILALMGSADLTKKDAHVIFNTLLDQGNLVEIRGQRL